MDSKFSRAVRPNVKAAALPVATAQHHDDQANAQKNRQEPKLRLPDPYSYDNINVGASIIAPATCIPQRRNSAPTISSSTSAGLADMDHSITNTVFRCYEERLRMFPELLRTDPEPPPAIPTPPPAPPALPPREPKVQCIICCTELPDSKDPHHVKEVVKPCRQCGSAYCGPCIKRMFTECCKDTTRMPPRCCGQIQIHYAKPHLTKDELLEFKSKYEEWLTPNPFYCPVPTCSAFIPERLLPEQATKNKGMRVDSGIGTSTPKAFACLTCSADICPDCRQVAHPNGVCNISEFGIDAETTELLKSWGYKRCPKCGHGLKRMYGCLHMECRCGAHFCYVCMGEPEVCGENCANECEEDEEDEYDSEGELTGPDEVVELDDDTDSSDDTDPSEVIEPHEVETVSGTTDAPEPPKETSQVEETIEQATIATPQPAIRPRNLDGGGQRYWAEQRLNFGEEPGDDYQDRSWNCNHQFEPYTIPLSKALVNDPSTEMECVKCWCPIHPQIEAPNTSSDDQTKLKTVPTETVRRIGRGFFRGNGRRGGRGQGRYTPPRGLYQAGDAIGTAPHLTTTVPSPLFQSVPIREASPMEDLQYSFGRVVDTSGNIVATSEVDTQRQTSDGSFVATQEATDKTTLSTSNVPSTIFPTTRPAKFSLAHECASCDLLVCTSCRDAILAAADRKEENRIGK